MIRRYLVFLAVVAVALVTAVAYRPMSQQGWPDFDDSKSLKFSHKTHIQGASIECATCHAAAASSKASDSLRPTHDNCTSCHEEQLTNDCAYCHVDPENIQAAPAPVREIVFSHEQHTAMADVACTTCHAGLEEADFGTAKHMPAMATCATCHNERKATNQCEACHTNVTALVPADHLVADFKSTHRELTRLGELEASCSTCHTQSFCAECHSAAEVLQFGRGPMMSDPTPRTFAGVTTNTSTLQMAHDLNYRFTHGIDAKAKGSDCYTCHSAQEFCAPCHETGDNIGAVRGFKPSWHLGAGFATLGVGSGGGRHAALARRDIESCVACHDAEGGDPTCITCHSDADGFRGTDPRTHVAGYMKGEYGPWHAQQGATCYNCHTDMNAHPGGVKGRNFCGYCHG
ncbi:MAG: cytochrome c3 family protein [Bacteroidetes bacterium]|nr:cytochrome c3 family protein [Bacteroidota bacterium]